MSYNYDAGFDLVEILGDDEFVGDEFGPEYYAGAAPVRLPRFTGGQQRPTAAIMRQAPMGAFRPGMIAARPQLSPAQSQANAQRAAYNNAMTNAIAERRAMAGALLHESTPTKAREYPLGFASADTIAAGASSRITTRPQVPFRLDRLVVPSDIAGLFTIDDVKVGKNSQFAAEGAVPARVFQENSVGVCLKGDTAQISMDITLNVTNISGGASRFRAAVIGPAVE